MSEGELIEIFLQEQNIGADHPFAERVRSFLNTEYQEIGIQVARRDTPAYIEAVRTGKTDEYWSNIRRQYYSGEISYTPDTPPQTPVPPESFSSQNPEFIVFRREI